MTLVELIVSVVLFSIIASMGLLFISTGVSSFIISRNASNAGPIAQNAAARINMELRTADGVAGSTVTFAPNSSVTYTSTDSDLPGTRRIHYDAGDGRLYLEVNGADHLLLDGVGSFTMAVTQDDLDGNVANGNEIAAFVISFTMAVAPNNAFNLEIMPREFIRL